jgi:hypothetical protein
VQVLCKEFIAARSVCNRSRRGSGQFSANVLVKATDLPDELSKVVTVQLLLVSVLLRNLRNKGGHPIQLGAPSQPSYSKGSISFPCTAASEVADRLARRGPRPVSIVRHEASSASPRVVIIAIDADVRDSRFSVEAHA